MHQSKSLSFILPSLKYHVSATPHCPMAGIQAATAPTLHTHLLPGRALAAASQRAQANENTETKLVKNISYSN